MFLEALSSCVLHAFRGRGSKPLRQPVHCTALPVRNSPLVSECNFLSCNSWLLTLGFPVPPSGEGMFCPTILLLPPLLTHFQLVFHQHHQVLLLRAVPTILFWWRALLGHKCKNVDLSSLNFMMCLSTIPAALPSPSEQRLCSPKHQLQLPQVHVICNQVRVQFLFYTQVV